MKQGAYVAALIIIGISIAVAASLIALTIDLTLIKSERTIDNIKPDQTLNDIANGTIPEKIIDEINTLTKQD